MNKKREASERQGPPDLSARGCQSCWTTIHKWDAAKSAESKQKRASDGIHQCPASDARAQQLNVLFK